MKSWCSTWPPHGPSRHPCKTKTSQETRRSLQKFLEPDRNPKVIYADNSWEFGKACEDLSWNHCTSTPHRSETNGIAERAVRRMKEGTSVVLLQSGLNESWWADSMECYTYLRNVTDLLSDGKTPYERCFGQPFKGPIIPFGSLVEYHPKTAKDQSRIHQFGKKVLPGLFLGYALYAVDKFHRDSFIEICDTYRRYSFFNDDNDYWMILMISKFSQYFSLFWNIIQRLIFQKFWRERILDSFWHFKYLKGVGRGERSDDRFVTDVNIFETSKKYIFLFVLDQWMNLKSLFESSYICGSPRLTRCKTIVSYDQCSIESAVNILSSSASDFQFWKV